LPDDPIVILSGASRGVGAATARWLAKAGAAVTLFARSAEALASVAEDVQRLGGTALVLTGDVSDVDACRAVVAQTLERFGRLDAVINNAGMVEPLAPVSRSDYDGWQYSIAVNLLGPFYLTRTAIEDLRRQKGRIVNVSSGAAVTSIESASAYCAAKAGLNHFSRVLAAEEPQVTVMAVRPGVVDTQMQDILRQKGPGAMPPEQLAYYQNLKADGRLEKPEVPGRSLAWLALHGPREFSGQFLDYDDPRISQPALAVFGDKLV
jgi:NAD(P)-dependent dehydrogenase (short-subunit alcohol dehydrogenase family)